MYINFVLKYLTQLRIVSTMVKIGHLRVLKAFIIMQNNSDVCEKPDIDLIGIVEEKII